MVPQETKCEMTCSECSAYPTWLTKIVGIRRPDFLFSWCSVCGSYGDVVLMATSGNLPNLTKHGDVHRNRNQHAIPCGLPREGVMPTKYSPPGKAVLGQTSSWDVQTFGRNVAPSQVVVTPQNARLGCHSPGRRGKQATCTKTAYRENSGG